jgi:hypothetical protein
VAIITASISFHRIEHPSEILKLLRFRELPRLPGGVLGINIAERYDVLALHRLQIAAALVAKSSGGNIQFIVWRYGRTASR